MGRIGNPDGLLDFAGTHDRRHVLFVGRQIELDWLLTLAEKTRTAGPEPEDATGDTVTIHACLGMRKTASMDEFRRRAQFNQPPITFEESRSLLATVLRKGELERDDDAYELSIPSIGDYVAQHSRES